MSVCVLFFFWEMGSLVFSHFYCTHMQQREMNAWNPPSSSPCWPLSLLHYCTDLRLLSKLINKGKVADSRLGKLVGEGKEGFIFRERQNAEVFQVSETLSDSWMPVCCSSSPDRVFAAGVVFVWVLLPVPELLVCHFKELYCLWEALTGLQTLRRVFDSSVNKRKLLWPFDGLLYFCSKDLQMMHPLFFLALSYCKGAFIWTNLFFFVFLPCFFLSLHRCFVP